MCHCKRLSLYLMIFSFMSVTVTYKACRGCTISSAVCGAKSDNELNNRWTGRPTTCGCIDAHFFLVLLTLSILLISSNRLMIRLFSSIFRHLLLTHTHTLLLPRSAQCNLNRLFRRAPQELLPPPPPDGRQGTDGSNERTTRAAVWKHGSL